MEVEDPISAKFQTLVESLMAKTTSEIMKVFAEVLLETRVEIARSWREIDELKQKLEASEEQRAESILRSEPTVDFKGETEEVLVSHKDPQIAVSDARTDCPVDSVNKGVEQIPKDAITENSGITQSSVVVHEPATSQTAPDASAIIQTVDSSSQTQETPASQTVVKRKRGRPSKSSDVAELQQSTAQSEEESNSPPQATSVINPEQPLSCSTGIIILSKNTDKKRAVVTRKKYIQKRSASVDSISITPTLRDRQLLNNQRPCLCCSSDQCSEQEQPKNNPQVVPRVYTCSKCRKKFHERMRLKDHKCSTVHECSRCGQTFKNLKNLATHKRSAQSTTKPFPYCCYLCGHMFATQCGWNMHKRIHAHSNVAENPQHDDPKPTLQLTLPRELQAKVEVRLERISDAQLEAALCPKSSSLQDEKAGLSSMATVQKLPSAAETPASTASASSPSAGTIMNAVVTSKESGCQTMTKSILGYKSGTATGENDRTGDPVIPAAASGQIQSQRKGSCSKSLTASIVASDECEEESSGSDELTKGFNSLTRKRKMSDCNHDVYNGVFPVEKILRWRNAKGRNEVRVKWMPCSLCGAKWKNTWEPAESFTSYEDSKNEESETQTSRT